jgi:LacI family transcriptional regulator
MIERAITSFRTLQQWPKKPAALATLLMTNKSVITVKQIAELAGCSRAAAAAALNPTRGTIRVGEQMRQRVLEIAQQHNYRPNLAARGVASRKSMVVGALVQNEPHNKLTHPLTWPFILGINDGLAHSGYTMALVRLTDVLEGGGLQAPVFKGHLLDGMVVVNAIPAEAESRVEDLVPKCVWLDANVWRDTNCIRRDEAHAAMTATKALLDAGYRRLKCVHGNNPGTHFSLSTRLAAIQQETARAGVEVESFIPPFAFKRSNGGWEEVYKFVDTLTPDVGVIAENIYSAEMLSKACAALGKRPGHDFALVCCDAHMGGGLEWPQLSHVSFKRYDMGLMAAQMMLKILERPEEPCPSQLLRGEWMEGDTLQTMHR